MKPVWTLVLASLLAVPGTLAHAGKGAADKDKPVPAPPEVDFIRSMPVSGRPGTTIELSLDLAQIEIQRKRADALAPSLVVAVNAARDLASLSSGVLASPQGHGGLGTLATTPYRVGASSPSKFVFRVTESNPDREWPQKFSDTLETTTIRVSIPATEDLGPRRIRVSLKTWFVLGIADGPVFSSLTIIDEPIAVSTPRELLVVSEYKIELTPARARAGDLIHIAFSPEPDPATMKNIKVFFDADAAMIVEIGKANVMVGVPRALTPGNRTRVHARDMRPEFPEGVPVTPFVEFAVESGSPFAMNNPLLWAAAALLVLVCALIWYLMTSRKRLAEAAKYWKQLERANVEALAQAERAKAEATRRADLRRNEQATTAIEKRGPAIADVPGTLADACAQGRCVLVAGSGVSKQAGLLTWSEILQTIVDQAAANDPAQDWHPLRVALQGHELSRVADLLEHRLGRDKLLPMLRDMLDRPAGLVPEVYDVARVIRAIPFPGVINTTYDYRLAEALAMPEAATLSARDSEAFDPLLRGDPYFLLNLNGDLRKPETVLFTTEDLRRAIAQNDWVAKFLAFSFGSKVFFFAGISLEMIQEFVRELRLSGPASPEPMHFALVVEEEDFASQEELFRTRFGIQLLGYRPSDDYGEFVDFFRQLKKAVDARPRAERAEVRTPHLDRITLKNIGPFDSLDLHLHKQKDESASNGALWNTFLGNNGCGKSSLLRAIALGLCGSDREGRESAARLLKTGKHITTGTIELRLGEETYMTRLVRQQDGRVEVESRLTPLQTGRWVVLGFPAMRGATQRNPKGPGAAGPRQPIVQDVLPLLQGVVDWRLDNLKQWIVNCHTTATSKVKEPDEALRAQQRLDAFFDVLAAFIPGVTCKLARIDENYQVWVATDDGEVPIDQVSQGTGSILAWVGTLVQRMYEIHREAKRPEDEPALVLIDEIDAHMHPEWQQLLVPTLKQKFPKLQVIASTHSPLIVLNMLPGEIIKLTREGRKPAIEAELGKEIAPSGPGRITYEVVTEPMKGQTAAQALTGPLDMRSARDLETAKVYLRYTELAARAQLSSDERAELHRLADTLKVSLASPEETAEARQARAMIEKMYDEQLRQLSADKRKRLLDELTVQLQETATGSRRP